METWEAGIFEYHDKMELKDYAAKGVRVVPGISSLRLLHSSVSYYDM
jgi:2,3,4,5-tetrahydropyridine-2-carboxylate N-succinyltransferase